MAECRSAGGGGRKEQQIGRSDYKGLCRPQGGVWFSSEWDEKSWCVLNRRVMAPDVHDVPSVCTMGSKVRPKLGDSHRHPGTAGRQSSFGI